MKKCARNVLIAAMICAALLLSAAFPAFAASGDGDGYYEALAELLARQDSSHFFERISLRIGSDFLTVDDTEVKLEAAPVLRDDRTMLPMETLADVIGAENSADAEAGTFTITTIYGDTILCHSGERRLLVNGETVELDCAPFCQNDVIYLPLRAIAEALCMEVEWIGETQTAAITAPYQTARLMAKGGADWTGADIVGADTALYDGHGLWILQFSTPQEAYAAHNVLNSMGVIVEADKYVHAWF